MISENNSNTHTTHPPANTTLIFLEYKNNTNNDNPDDKDNRNEDNCRLGRESAVPPTLSQLEAQKDGRAVWDITPQPVDGEPSPAVGQHKNHSQNPTYKTVTQVNRTIILIEEDIEEL